MFNRAFLALKAYAFGTQRAIPGLDGLRAISIAFVLAAHLNGTQHFPGIVNLIPGDLGSFGVRVFFVISGYLITSILLSELRRTGDISLRRFYFRRTLRLFPASYIYIAVMAVLAGWNWVHPARWDFPFAATYSMNFYDGRGWPLGHLWSLAVEEQFYLLWPFTLLMLGPARAGRFLVGVLATAPLLRLASPYVGPTFNFLIWSDALGTGCLLSIFREELFRHPLYSRVLSSRWFFLVPLAALGANAVPFTKIHWLFCETIMNVTIAVTIDRVMRNPGGAVGRFLNLPAVSFMGVLSYSLYLWQQPFINRHAGEWYCAFPVNVLFAFGMALASFLLIEAPFLRLRSAVERTWNERRERGAVPALASQQ